MSVSVLLKTPCQTIGEGPHWMDKSQSLLFVDIYSGEIHRHDTTTGQHDKLALGELVKSEGDDTRVGFVVPRSRGGYLAGVNRRLYHVDWEARTVTALCDGVEEGSDNLFNDGKCDATGRLWAGTMAVSRVPGKLTPDVGSLYSLETDGRLVTRLRPVSISNGLAWSADGRTMFYIDSYPRKVYAFDYDAERGSIENQKTVADWSSSPLSDMGYPDGMCTDQDDKLWIACFFGGKVVRLDPETGQVLQSVHFPTPRVTSCCFGGPNHDQLFVTSSRYHTDSDEMQKYPLTGSVFKVTGLDAKGRPGHEYEG